MSATEKIKKIGVIAGGGDMPDLLVQSCRDQGIEIFLIGLEGYYNGIADLSIPLGRAGRALHALRDCDITDIVLIGGLQRPEWWQLWPDLTTLHFILRYGLLAGGDDDLLCKLRQFLADKGLTLHGAHHFMQNYLAPSGVLTEVQPKKKQVSDIDFGFQASQNLGQQDVGQAVMVKDGVVIAQEGHAGTDAMLQSCYVSGVIVVKSCKPQQDMDLDLPTIGLRTIENAHKAGAAGVVIHSGRSFFLDREDCVAYANTHNMFIVGYDG